MDTQALVAGFRDVATASVADAVDSIAGRTGFLPQSIKPRINENKVVGPAVTILEGPTEETVPPQHALDAIDEAEAGSVIVISTNGTTDVAVWGGLMTAGAVANNMKRLFSMAVCAIWLRSSAIMTFRSMPAASRQHDSGPDQDHRIECRSRHWRSHRASRRHSGWRCRWRRGCPA